MGRGWSLREHRYNWTIEFRWVHKRGKVVGWTEATWRHLLTTWWTVEGSVA